MAKLEDTAGTDWSKLAKLTPRLRSHLGIIPQEYRGKRWFLLQDRSNGRYLLLDQRAWSFVGRLDGEASIEALYDSMSDAPTEDALSRNEILAVLSQLHAAELLNADLPHSTKAFFNRTGQQGRHATRRAPISPLSIRVPLVNPDQLLERLIPWFRPVFSKFALTVWFAVVALAGLLAIANVTEISAAAQPDMLSPANLASMLMVYVFMKAVHELAHGLAVKMWHGEVHEMGISLIVLAPLPYVDASAAWSFRDPKKRIVVSAVGILSELLIAAIALFVWLMVEPGLLKDVAWNAFLIGSISTVLFNANPLMKFDGYYVLQDWIQVPNLQARSGKYYRYLVQRYLLGMDNTNSPCVADGEQRWFAVYGGAAFVYRLLILFVIVLFLAEEYLFLGVALASWAVFMQLVLPVWRAAKFLMCSPLLGARRPRALAVSGGVFSFAALTLFAVPMPSSTRAEGVVTVPHEAHVVAPERGFVARQLVASGSRVQAGQVLIELRDAELDAAQRVLKARVRELEVLAAQRQADNRVKAAVVREDVRVVREELQAIAMRQQAMVVHSTVAGIFVVPGAYDLANRYLEKGELIGYVLSRDNRIVTAVLPQADVGLIRNGVSAVQLRLAQQRGAVIQSRVLRELPGSGARLPSAALGAAGGGSISVIGDGAGAKTAAEEVFTLELSLPVHTEVAGIGARAHVRFDHAAEPLGFQWIRQGRQLLLGRLSF